MEELAKITSKILLELADYCKPGVTGVELDKYCESRLKVYGVKSYNKGYKPAWAKRPFPGTLCISPNGVMAHGLPSNYAFVEGDIVTLDLGITKDGLCGDAAITVGVGKLSNADDRLLRHARKVVYEAIKMIRPGVNTRDIADKIQKWSLLRGYVVNRRTAGHAIGEQMHMKPNIYNTVEDGVHAYEDLKEGQYFCIEPVLTSGKDAMGTVLSDGWSRVTLDGKQSAMFEHMVKVTADGCEVLTDHFNDL